MQKKHGSKGKKLYYTSVDLQVVYKVRKNKMSHRKNATSQQAIERFLQKFQDSAGMDIQNTLWHKLFNDVEYWMLQVTVHCFTVILKCGIKHYKSCNSYCNENVWVKFSMTAENSLYCKD